MEYQLDFYKKAFDDFIEFHFIKGIHEVEKVYDTHVAEKFNGPFYWWGQFDDEKGITTGAIESANYVIDYINKSGPYDGVFGFSQGTLICRMLLKNKELRKYWKELLYPLKFGILVSGPSYFHLNPFPENPDDYNILHTKYEQPLFYLYGMHDPLIGHIQKWIVEDGEYWVYLHGGRHKIPRLVGHRIQPLLRFLSKWYIYWTKSPLTINKEIDEQFEIDYFRDFEVPTKSKI